MCTVVCILGQKNWPALRALSRSSGGGMAAPHGAWPGCRRMQDPLLQPCACSCSGISENIGEYRRISRNIAATILRKIPATLGMAPRGGAGARSGVRHGPWGEARRRPRPGGDGALPRQRPDLPRVASKHTRYARLMVSKSKLSITQSPATARPPHYEIALCRCCLCYLATRLPHCLQLVRSL